MGDDLSDAVQPVFLEPRDDYWEIHTPERLSMAEQREYQLATKAAAEQLETAFYCEDCFPRLSRRQQR